jgi:hypothetical protein
MNTSPELLAAMITSAVALLGVVINSFILSRSTLRTTEKEHQLQEKRLARERQEHSAAVISRYRDPLLRAADSLQSRLYNIMNQNFLSRYLSDPQTHDYALNSTLYAVAEYLAWVEILRRDVQFLDLGEVDLTRGLENRLRDISEIFLNNNYDPLFKLFRVEQRAIGELMIIHREGSIQSECIGYVEFTRGLQDPKFMDWFNRLAEDVKALAENPGRIERIRRLQNALVKLMDELDPDCVRIPKNARQEF